jgi:rhamnose utilization protein RhaD (predicted bifunctional aldolase and dehydrogenase)
MAGMDELIDFSRAYGANPDWLLAGGGNTSWKEGQTLHVKASGGSLGAIDAGGFCAMDRPGLDAIWRKTYPAAAEAREAAVLADLLAARRQGETRRPSVETLMHGLFPQAYVLHTHPSLVNGLTCGREGRAGFERLFSDLAIWVPFVEPGYTLAKLVKEAAEAYKARRGAFPQVMLMENHGLLVAADTRAELDRLSDLVVARVSSELRRRPCLEARAAEALAIREAQGILSSLAGPSQAMFFRSDEEILMRASSAEGFAPLSAAFTPDHIVYAGHEFLRADSPAAIPGAWADYLARNGTPPRIALVRGLGAFSAAKDGATARNAMLLFVDACKVAAFSESFGGPSHMTAPMIEFIRGWEAEKYRAQVGSGSEGGKP